jgi:hypothetical protein
LIIGQIPRFEPTHDTEDQTGDKTSVETDNKPGMSESQSPKDPPRALSPLTSIGDSDSELEDNELPKSSRPAHGSDLNQRRLDKDGAVPKRSTKRPRPRVSEPSPDVDSMGVDMPGGSAKRPRRQNLMPEDEPSAAPVPSRKDPKKASKARTGASALMCHQCRSTNKWAKMTCTNMPDSGVRCKRRYCANCIMKRSVPSCTLEELSSITHVCRYKDIVFDENSTTFICPCCTDVCNCTVCTRKRGEEYISTRASKLADDTLSAGNASGTLASTSAAHARPEKKTKKSHSSSKKTDPLIKTANIIEDYGGVSGAYWGAVFSVRGERIGQGFIGQSVSDIIVKEETPVVADESSVAQGSDEAGFEAEPFSDNEDTEALNDSNAKVEPELAHAQPSEDPDFSAPSPAPFDGRSCTS